MNITTIVFIALALSMDAFAVSIASGVIIKKQRVRKALLFAFMFGSFQMFMPVIGWGAGHSFRGLISGIDHWIAFGLLFVIGSKMIYEAVRIESFERSEIDMSALTLLGLSIATSIDALAVGVSFAFLQVSIILPVLVIGAVTFILSFAGVFAGSKYGGLFEKKIEIIGGAILILIGFKILLSHILTQGAVS